MDRLPTMTALRSRNVNLGSTTCKLCGDADETTDHIFIACHLAIYIWGRIESWCNLPTIFAFSFRDLMELPRSMARRKQSKELILSVMQTSVWCIWKARNDAVFHHRKVLKEKIVDDIKTLSYFWVKHRMRSCGLDWASWLSFDVGLAGHDYFLTGWRQVHKSNINTKLELLPQSRHAKEIKRREDPEREDADRLSCYHLLLQPVLTLTPESRPQETPPVVRLTVCFVVILAGLGHQPDSEGGCNDIGAHRGAEFYIAHK
ncbi:hypothetical protein E3N88_19815 [Mikania micrantha]|uniref:Reverse transcriptase zinc-binding domain-containing protein n=1 Tax=Mikania micrantha TaxID=192012 RepID=A0A5N6NQM0_9ASTR|nr:hypothetical protein E3N88_19815 [Mikania micrantha]